MMARTASSANERPIVKECRAETDDTLGTWGIC